MAADGAQDDVRAMVVDSHPEFIRALHGVFRHTRGFRLDLTAGSGHEAVALARTHRPDLILIDLELADGDGAHVAGRIVDAAPGAVMILMSTYRREDLPTDLESCGAAAYVRKDELSPGVLAALWRAHSRR